VELQVEIAERAHQIPRKASGGLEWNGCFLLTDPVYTQQDVGFGNSTHVLS